jgi:hypothetical protein
MGGVVPVGNRRSEFVNEKEKGEWFTNQGYFLNLDIRANADAAADCNMPIYDIGRFSCSLPSANPTVTQRNCDVSDMVITDMVTTFTVIADIVITEKSSLITDMVITFTVIADIVPI